MGKQKKREHEAYSKLLSIDTAMPMQNSHNENLHPSPSPFNFIRFISFPFWLLKHFVDNHYECESKVDVAGNMLTAFDKILHLLQKKKLYDSLLSIYENKFNYILKCETN